MTASTAGEEGGRDRPTVFVKPVSRKLQATLHPLRSEHEVNRAAELVRDEVADWEGALAGIVGRGDRWPADFAPMEHQTGWVSVQPPTPLDRRAAILSRQRTVFCGIGGELMEHHGHRLPSFGAQHDFGAAGFRIVACGIRCELTPD